MKIFITETQLTFLKESFSKEYFSLKSLINSAPKELKDRFFGGWNIKQRADFHPEGNTLKHMMIVTKRAFSLYPNDLNLILAAFFHDIGKDVTYAINPKTNQPTAFGHEKVSGELVKKYSDWVESFGANPYVVKNIVDNHMRIKTMDVMTPKKIAELESNPNFSDIVKFNFIDKGGMKMLDVPRDVRKLALDFKKHGNKLYLVGGAVRDMFLKKKAKDYDLATNATPDKIKEILEAEKYEKIIPKGAAFGVISVIINGEEYEIATFREDGEYKDKRRPDSVKFSDISKDAERRDLTINALYYDIINDKIIDLVGGIDDISKNKVRTVGEPRKRFEEDRIRILRAIRFAGISNSKLNDDIESEILRDNSLKGVSPERIRDEFIKGILKSKSTKYYLQLVDKMNLFDEIFQNLNINKDFIDSKNYIVVLAALLKNNNINIMANVLNKFKYWTAEINKIVALISLVGLEGENAVYLKRKIINTGLDNESIVLFLKDVLNVDSKLIKAFVDFYPSVNGIDVEKTYNLHGKELGKKIAELEQDNFNKLLN